MNNFKKDLLCNIVLISILVFSAVHLTVLTLGLFNVIDLNVTKEFNYITAYTLCFVSLMLFIFAFSISKLKNWVFPSWLRVVIYYLFFFFTNTYYICNFWNNIYAVMFFVVYIAFCINIFSVSLFYNLHKDDKNKLKTSKTYMSTFIFTYSVTICSFFMLIVAIFKAYILKNYALATLSAFIVEFSAMLLTCIVMLVIFNLSLSKTKKFINSCLIKKIK